jgi:ribose/xylose/arabinose/galactoside ABC-type transport system permease subunit
LNTAFLKESVRRANVSRTLERHGEIVVFLLLVVMSAGTAMVEPLFLSGRNISNVLRQASALGIVSIGQTIAILSFGIDLSVSSVATMAGVLCASLMQGRPEMVVPAVLIALGFGLAIGLLNGLLVTKFGLADFIVTLATWSIVNGVMFVYTEGREVGSVTRGFMFLSGGNIGPFPMSLIVWVVAAIAAFVFLRYTRLGRHIFAVGGNKEIARLSGIHVNLVKTLVYAISGFLAAIAGLVLLARLGVGYPLAGREFQLDSIAAVVIGGTSLFGGRGGVVGTIAGVLIVSALNNIFNLVGVSAFSQHVLKGLVIIVVVVIRARGDRA